MSLLPTHFFLFFQGYFQVINRHVRDFLFVIWVYIKCSFRIICKCLITIYICLKTMACWAATTKTAFWHHSDSSSSWIVFSRVIWAPHRKRNQFSTKYCKNELGLVIGDISRTLSLKRSSQAWKSRYFQNMTIRLTERISI